MTSKIAIIGAGMAGLTAARLLQDAGRDVLVFDKSRGLGGRLATRRRDGFALDHGAGYLTSYDADFRALLTELSDAGAAAHWPKRGHVGLPGMSGLVRPLARGLRIVASTEIAGLAPHAGGLVLTDTKGAAHGPFATVISAIPAPQARRLLTGAPAEDAMLASVTMNPVWALLLAFQTPIEAADEIWPDAPLSMILRGSAKPGRAARPDTWVVHARPDWSAKNLERAPDEIAQELTDRFLRVVAQPVSAPIYQSAHRWRYALTETPLGQSHISAYSGRLLLGGDWALGPRAEDAWASGRAMARNLLS